MTTVAPARDTSARAAARRRDLLLLYGLGLLVHAAVALVTRSPSYVDDHYYFNAGRMIATGEMQFPELLEPYFWNYAVAPDALPAPGFAYWQPLPSLLAALGIAVLRFLPAFRAAQVVFALLGALLPPLAYTVAAQVGERRHAMLAGLLACFTGMYARYWPLPESFTPFALSTAGAMLLSGLGRERGRRWAWLAAGVCAGLSHLARADGLLVIAVVAFVAVLPPRWFRGEYVNVPARQRALSAVLAVAGYLVVMAPWFARNLAVFGSVQAPGGLNALWLVEYNDLFNYPSNLTPGRYFAAGWGTILAGKARALWLNLLTLIGVHGMAFLVPLALVGWVRRWRQPWVLPMTIYGLALFAAMTFAFSLPGMRGGWLHSSAALVPFVMAMAACGLEDTVRWVASRRSTWHVASAWRVFGGASVVIALLVTIAMTAQTVGEAANSSVRRYAAIGETLDALGAPADARIVSNDPPAMHTVTGHGGIPLVNGDEANLLRAADDYSASFLVLDRHVPDGLMPLYQDGPSSPRLVLIETYQHESSPAYLYQILPAD
ncbi:MAG: hypothetical protein GX484_08975 [Chloroflexi bacterium]|nr:hypothetical protein [Chloroflexota bacterium]